MKVQNYEEVEHFPIDPEMQEKILLEQNECSFVWGPKDNWAVGVIMSYVWRDGKFWLTASSWSIQPSASSISIYPMCRSPACWTERPMMMLG